MPFYVSPEQSMKDKADYARKAIARIRSGVVIACEAGILFIAPNPSRALRKFSEIYDRIAFAAVGRYNEFENLRKAGVRYADMTGFQYDRQDVSARGLANWYAQLLGTIFTESQKPYEVEIVVAEVGKTTDGDQIYRITFDGSVADEHGFVVMGGQADQVAAVLKDQYSDGMTLGGAFGVAIAALAGPGNGDRQEITATQLEVALLDRGREHRTFRRLTGPRLEALLTEAIPGKKPEAITEAGRTGTGSGSTDADTGGTSPGSGGTSPGSGGTSPGSGEGTEPPGGEPA
jgi:proteasome alpha subunit